VKFKAIGASLLGFLLMLIAVMVLLTLFSKLPVVGGVFKKAENLAESGTLNG